MLHKQDNQGRTAFVLMTLDEMVPKDHYLRDIAEFVDFDFIYELVEPLYDAINGRPSIDPVLLIKLPLLQYLEGLKSMRETIKQVQVNAAYRWFLGLTWEDEVPHFTTFGKNYTRRFKETDLFEQIFYNILNQAVEAGLVDSRVVFVDGTHIKAHANNHKYEKLKVPEDALFYKEALDNEIKKERDLHAQRALKSLEEEKREVKEKKVSTTDPEAGWFHIYVPLALRSPCSLSC